MVTTVYRAAYGDTVRHRRRIIQRGDGNFTNSTRLENTRHW